MYRLRAIFTLLCFLLQVQGTAMAQDQMTTGILEPGGSYTGLDGITIDASHSNLQKPLEVFIERLSESKIPYLGLSTKKPETAFYRIGAVTRFVTKVDKWLQVHVPLPQGAFNENLVVNLWTGLGDDPLHPDSQGWSAIPIKYSAENNEVTFPRGNLDPKGKIFVVTLGAYTPK